MNKISFLLVPLLAVVGCDTAVEEIPTSQEYHEAVVVGSGYGGSVAALRLAQANIPTVVFEKGRRWTVTDTSGANNVFATLDSVQSLPVDSRSTWLDTLCIGTLMYWSPCRLNTGILEVTSGSPNKYDFSPKFASLNTRVMAGVGVGGGSLVNNGETFAPTRMMWEAAYDLEAMPYLDAVWNELQAEYFEKALSVLKPAYIPQDILASDYYSIANEHIQAMMDAGYPLNDGVGDNINYGSSHTPMIVDWDAVREEMSGLRTPSIIDGEAWLGINSGAKKSLDKDDSYLGLAEKTGNVEVRALHTVSSIAYDNDSGLYQVVVIKTDEEYNALESITVSTPNLIMAAGSVGTTKLLVSAKYKNGLPNLNEYVGTKWVNNGNSATFRSKEVNPESQGMGGPASIKTLDFSDPDAPINVQMLPLKFPTVVQWLGVEVFTIALGVPQGEGYFDYDSETDTVNLNWPKDGSTNVYDRFMEIMETMDPSGNHVPLPAAAGQGVTLHPLGGMPLGLATDEQCRVKGYNGLYAVDGSIVPGPSLANPSLLIAALAERCMDAAVSDIIASRAF